MEIGGNGNLFRNDYRGTHFRFQEEFLSSAANVDFTGSTTGTGALSVGIAMSAGGAGARLGIGTLETGTTTTGLAARRTSTSMYPGAWTKSVYEATLGPETLSTSGEEYGVVVGFFGTVNSLTQSDGVYLLYDRANGATGGVNSGNANKWQAFACNGGTRTRVLLDGTSQDGAGGAGSIATVNSALAATSLPNTNFHTVAVEVYDTSRAVFKIDNVVVATLTTNLPANSTVLVAGTLLLKSAGTTNRRILMDRHQLDIDLPAARTP